jgi:hypothetical protein
VADMKLRNLVPSLSDPQGLSSRILGAITGGQKQGETPRSPIGTVLDALGGLSGASGKQPAGKGTPAPASGEKPPAEATPPAGPKPQPEKDERPIEDLLRALRGKKPPPKPEEQKAP